MPDLSHLRIGKVPSAFAEMAEKHNELVQLIASIEAASGINIKMVSSPEKKLKVPGTTNTITRKPRGRIRIGIQPAANGQNLTTQLNELHFRYYNSSNALVNAYDVDNTNGAVWTDVTNSINVGIATNGAMFSYDTAYTNQIIKPNGYTGNMYNPSTTTQTTYLLDETGFFLKYYNSSNSLVRSYDVTNNNGVVWTDVPNSINVGIASNGTIFSYDTAYNNQMIKPNGYTGHMYNPSTSIETSYVLDETGLLLYDTLNFDYFKVERKSNTTQVQLFNITNAKTMMLDAKNVIQDMSIKTINVCVDGNTKSMLIIASDPF